MALETTDKAKAQQLLDDSRSYLQSNDASSAQDAAVEARGLFRKAGEAALEAEAVQCIVRALTLKDDLEEATREAYDALNIVKRANDDEAVAAASSLVVGTHYNSLNKEDSDRNSDAFREGVKELLGTAEESVKAHKKVKNVAGQGYALSALARVQMLADKPDNAKLSADWAYMLFYQVKDGNGLYDACMTLAYAHLMRGDFASSMRYTNEAKDICQQFQDGQRLYEVIEMRELLSNCTLLKNEAKKLKGSHQQSLPMGKFNFR
jgi:hypothetical protein